MYKILLLIGLAFGAILMQLPVSIASVVWDFYQTSCTPRVPATMACIATQQYPLLLMSITLPGPDSAGTAEYVGPYRSGLIDKRRDPPLLTGDAFTFNLADASQDEISNLAPLGRSRSPPVWFSISWNSVGGELKAIYISFDTPRDTVFMFGLTGGVVASDYELGGCRQSQCNATGSWIRRP